MTGGRAMKQAIRRNRSRNLNKTKKSNNVRNNNAMKILGITLGILFLVYIGVSVYFMKHFYLGTTINGVECSGLKVKQAEDLITKEVRNYTLTFEERGEKSEQIAGSDIELVTLFDSDLSDIKDKQNPFLWPVSFLKDKTFTIKTMLSFNEDVLKRYFDYLKCFDDEAVVKPVDAYISEYKSTGYEIVEAEYGNLVNKDKLFELAVKAINDLDKTINLEKEDCYVAPVYTSESEAIKNAVATMNTYVSSVITYEFGEAKEVLDGSKISEWLSVDAEMQVVIDEEKLKEYVDYLGKTYNTFGKTRTLHTSYNQDVQVSGGDYGWWLNRKLEQEELKTAIKEGKQFTKTPAYTQTAAQYGDDDVGNTYVEINLTAQHLFFYKEGALVTESDFVSGNVSKNTPTPKGTFGILFKKEKTFLTGEDYKTPVDYWMPFYDGAGLHDATWRSEFGKEIYKTSGSHGCINLPHDQAKTIYENISKGVAVFVYELPGTENTGSTDATAAENATTN